MVALSLIDQPARVKGLRSFRIELDRLVEIGQRLGQVALRAQQIGAAEISGGMVGIDDERLVEIGERRAFLRIWR